MRHWRYIQPALTSRRRLLLKTIPLRTSQIREVRRSESFFGGSELKITSSDVLPRTSKRHLRRYQGGSSEVPRRYLGGTSEGTSVRREVTSALTSHLRGAQRYLRGTSEADLPSELHLRGTSEGTSQIAPLTSRGQL